MPSLDISHTFQLYTTSALLLYKGSRKIIACKGATSSFSGSDWGVPVWGLCEGLTPKTWHYMCLGILAYNEKIPGTKTDDPRTGHVVVELWVQVAYIRSDGKMGGRLWFLGQWRSKVLNYVARLLSATMAPFNLFYPTTPTPGLTYSHTHILRSTHHWIRDILVRVFCLCELGHDKRFQLAAHAFLKR